jgi:exopolysaccharide production protein ExoZ
MGEAVKQVLKRPTFRGIQALRGIAASMVVIFHTTLMLSERPGVKIYPWTNGAAGVDVFFVISGFVMAVSTIGREHKTHPARSFLERRFIRLVPLYWAMTLLMVVKLAALRMAPRGAASPYIVETPFSYVLSSMLFLPYRNSAGVIFPIVPAGWTLSFEMLFYGLFALALALRMRVALLLTPVMITLAVISFFHTESWPTFTVLADPLLLEFLAGLLLGEAITKGFQGRIGLSVSLGLLALPVLLFIPEKNPPTMRVLFFGIPAYLLVQAVVSLEEQFGERWPRWMLLIGDASYSLYLSHIFILPFLMNLLIRIHLAPTVVQRPWEELIPVIASLVLALLIAIPLYLYVEEPTTNFLRRRLLHEGKPRSAAAS